MCRSQAEGGRRCPGIGRAKADIRGAVQRIADRTGGEWVGLADLRDELGNRYDRAVVDAALNEMSLGDSTDGVEIEEETNQKTLTQRDRAAALTTRGRRLDVIRVRPQDPSRAEQDAAAARRDARQAETDQIQGMPDAELRDAFAAATDRAQRMRLAAELARREMPPPATGPSLRPVTIAADEAYELFDGQGAPPAPTKSEPTEQQRATVARLGIGRYEHVPPPPPRVKGRMSEQRYYDTYDADRDVTVIDTDGTAYKHCGAITAHVIAKKQQPGVLIIRPVKRQP